MADPVGFEWKADWRPPGQLGRWASRTRIDRDATTPTHVLVCCRRLHRRRLCAQGFTGEESGSPARAENQRVNRGRSIALPISVPLSSVTSAMRIQSRNTKPLLGSSARSAQSCKGTCSEAIKPTNFNASALFLATLCTEKSRMEWIMVEDEYRRDPAIRVPNTTIMLYPMTMISKRLERDETVDVFELFNGLAAQIEELQRQDN